MRTIGLMGGASVLLEGRLRGDEGGELQLATNQYPWITFYRREGKDFNALLDQGLGEVAQAGLQGFEPIFNNNEEVRVLAPLLTKHGLRMGSFYVNSTLHDSTRAEHGPVFLKRLIIETAVDLIRFHHRRRRAPRDDRFERFATGDAIAVLRIVN